MNSISKGKTHGEKNEISESLLVISNEQLTHNMEIPKALQMVLSILPNLKNVIK